MSQFNAGDKVNWSSQAGGHHTTKEGTVVEIVPVNKRPSAITGSIGSPRNHVSYVVHVPAKTSKGKGKNYWPVASLLSKV